MSIKTLKIIRFLVVYGLGTIVTIAGGIITHKIDKTEQLDLIAKLVAEKTGK